MQTQPANDTMKSNGGKVIYLITEKPAEGAIENNSKLSTRAKIRSLKSRVVSLDQNLSGKSISPLLWIWKIAGMVYTKSVSIWHSIIFLIL